MIDLHIQQLELDFETKRVAMVKANEEFFDAATRVMKYESMKPKAQEAVKATASDLRDNINRLVRHLAVQKFGKNFHIAWIRTYERQGAESGYNPAAVNMDSKQTHLDQCESDGHLEDTLKAVQSLIQQTS